MKTERPVFSIRTEDAGFAVWRDGKTLETPLHFSLIIPTRDLAEAIVQEFAAQGEKTNIRKMPYMQMALTSIDITAQNLAGIIADLMRYGETELVCQRATDPADLVAEQNEIWQPYIDWCLTEFNADLLTGRGLSPFEQKKEALLILRKYIQTLDAFRLTGLSEACKTTGSLILGLALMRGRAGAEEVFRAAEFDHLWQSRMWGEDPVSEARYADIKRDLNACVRWFALLGK